MAKRVKCEECGENFYVERVKRFEKKILCNKCFDTMWDKLWNLNDFYRTHLTQYYLHLKPKFYTEIDFTPPDLFKSLDFKAAHQNESKLKSREIIVKTVKSVFGADNPVSFVEFLGGGHGALYYAKHLHINRMLLVEKEKKDFNNFYQTSYRQFCRQTWPMALDLHNVDLLDHLRIANPFYWNVINLDFCAYCYEYKNEGDESSLALIEEFFKTKAVCRNQTLLITSFMINGYTLRIAKVDNKTIYKDENEITAAITGLAAKYGFTLEKVLSNTYDSNPRTSMINLGFKIK